MWRLKAPFICIWRFKFNPTPGWRSHTFYTTHACCIRNENDKISRFNVKLTLPLTMDNITTAVPPVFYTPSNTMLESIPSGFHLPLVVVVSNTQYLVVIGDGRQWSWLPRNDGLNMFQPRPLISYSYLSHHCAPLLPGCFDWLCLCTWTIQDYYQTASGCILLP